MNGVARYSLNYSQAGANYLSIFSFHSFKYGLSISYPLFSPFGLHNIVYVNPVVSTLHLTDSDVIIICLFGTAVSGTSLIDFGPATRSYPFSNYDKYTARFPAYLPERMITILPYVKFSGNGLCYGFLLMNLFVYGHYSKSYLRSSLTVNFGML